MGRLLLLQARRDRVVLPVWVLGITALLLATTSSIGATYGGAGQRGEVLRLALGAPALLALRGVPNGDSLGSALHFQSYAFLAVAVGLMNTFLAVRHGRADEERGRRDLLDAAPVGRAAATAATVVLAATGNLVLGVLAVAGYLTAGLPSTGAVLSAAGLVLTGLAFLGIGLLAGEALPTSRAANGAAVSLVLLAYASRAAGDALGRPDPAAVTLDPAWPSALSPIGWGQQILPFTEDRARPILALAALAAATLCAGLVVRVLREAGTSLLPARPGRADAPGSLRSVLGLAWRLTRTALLAWTLGAALLGAATASLVGAVRDVRLEEPAIRDVAASLGHARGDLADDLLSAVLVLVGLLAAAAAIQAVLRAREEESSGRAEAILAGPRTRTGWLLAFALTGAATLAAVLTVTAAAVGIGYLLGDDPDGAARGVAQTLVQAPAGVALTAAAVLMLGAFPRIAVWGAWAVLALAVVVGLFGGLLDLPDDLVRFSPIGSVPVLPTDDWGPTAVMLVTSGVLVAAGVTAVRRRDLIE